MKNIQTIIQVVKTEFESGLDSDGLNEFSGLCEAAENCFRIDALTRNERRVFDMVWMTYAHLRVEDEGLFYNSFGYQTEAIIFGWKIHLHEPRIKWLNEQIEMYSK